MKKLLALIPLLLALILLLSVTAIAEEATCEHDYVAKVTPPRCQKDSFTTYTCSLCGDSYVVKGPRDRLVHFYGAWVPYEGDYHIAECSRKGCDHVGRNRCKYVTMDDAEIKVCMVCGKFGDKQFRKNNKKNITPARGTYVPAGEWIVRGMSKPAEGVAYAFTFAIEEAGKSRTFNGSVNVAVRITDKGIGTCKLYRADGATLTEVPFTYVNSYVTFDTDVSGLFVMLPAEQ